MSEVEELESKNPSKEAGRLGDCIGGTGEMWPHALDTCSVVHEASLTKYKFKDKSTETFKTTTSEH